MGTAAGAEAEVLGHGHRLVKVACQPVGAVRIAAERDRAAAFLDPPLRDPRSDRAAGVDLERSTAAGGRPHGLAKLVSKPLRIKIEFQFDSDVDYFELDPVAYAPVLGTSGMATYRARLSDLEAGLTPRPAGEGFWTSRHSHEWFVIEWNARRLAVLDRDIAAIIGMHARDRQVAAWLQDTAEAFEEIGEIDLAIDWAKQATDFDRGHQSLKAAGYWCRLLAEHRPSELLPARLEVFRRWPSSSTAADLYQDAGPSWPSYRDEVVATLSASPRDAVLFALLTLQEVQFAWDLAYSLGLDSDDVWARLASVYEKVEPLAVLPVLARLVDNDLSDAGAQHYRIAARRLAKMRTLATDTGEATKVDQLIVGLREKHRRRPRLQQEFDRAGLPRHNLT